MTEKKYPWWHSQFDSVQRAALLSGFDARDFTYGPNCLELEERFADICGRRYCVVTNSGTSALAIALLAFPNTGSCVLPELGWIATAQAVDFSNQRKIFVDVDRESPVASLPLIVGACGDSAVGTIIPVHYNGRVIDVATLKKEVKQPLVVIEDCCKAMFSGQGKWRAGVAGDCACFSFGMVSMVSGTYGGAVVTDDEDAYRRMRVIRNHGVHQQGDDVRCHESYRYSSFNFKPSGLHCAIALASLRAYQSRIGYVRELYSQYETLFSDYDGAGLCLMRADQSRGELPLLMDVKTDNLLLLRSVLTGYGIETMRYHPPLSWSLQVPAHSPNAESFYQSAVHLPSGVNRQDLDKQYFTQLRAALDEFCRANVRQAHG